MTDQMPELQPVVDSEEVDTELDDLLDGVDDDGTGDGEHPGAAGVVAHPRTVSNRALIRRVASKAAELVNAPKSRRETLASMLGAGSDLGDLTFAVMTADRGALAPATDLTAIAEAEPFSAGVVAGALGRPRMRAVWALLGTLHVTLPSVSIPPSDAKAAIALAQACHTLASPARDELAKVVALARKS